MPTRFYLPSTGAAEVSPAFDAGWVNIPANVDRLKCVTTRINSAMVDAQRTVTVGASEETVLVRQYVSAPIAAQTISGTVKLQARAREEAAGMNARDFLLLKVVSNDGSTVRGTLLALNSYKNTELNTTLTNKTWADGDALTSVTAQAGDRIVAEIGVAWLSILNRSCWVNFGDNSATDLPENETETAAYNPWLEFSMDIVFQGAARAQVVVL